jgi:hypothetical protein
MPNIRATEFAKIKAGNAAMYYPECNVLVNRTLDPHSKTPAFKGVLVRIEKLETALPPAPIQPAVQVTAD